MADTNKIRPINLENLETFAGEIKAKYAKKTEVVSSITAANDALKIGGTTTAPTIELQLSPEDNNALVIRTEDGKKGLYYQTHAADTYEIAKDTLDEDSEFAAIYRLKKNGTTDVGVPIQILRDKFLKSGTVETYEESSDWCEAGTYIKIQFQNSKSVQYINVNSLIEYVTSGSENGDAIVIAVDPVTHKVTATITDGTIGLTKLTDELQNT